ncbi:hypothetical protein CQY22_006300 [Mycolicibacterium brumae]|uniref:Terminal beta-(1->2)-arabinofuranosyltransferase C-terminal domain-containing protein n=2 Tax=Mycolicibacterium brumae TaxID=85968 RepID=A0A2G5PDB2_9MYCO|nr:flagellar motor control protein ZomB [Mycolicibacterium brumae]PIB76322.1 hypothetical protein CQY22_006300 [Mycolicibacterium brumae]RWA15830.1 hypothetical protein MBRU_09785 [Mycolicibacterium brumae DSM 44177]UWW07100.1 hypothetical protein L2Z93_000088 [Mycolicibacterium brumae]
MPKFPFTMSARVSLWSGVAVIGALFALGAWQRRWISDDGLIVLRTIRNLQAGNGPVFNAGERVEANTSTAWTYLNWIGAWVGGSVQLEYVALALALACSVAGVVLAMLGAGRLYAPSLVGRQALLLPASALVYIAIPPARDFATSGLETGLGLAYIGLLWWMMVCWSQRLRSTPTAGSSDGLLFTAAVAAVAGFSPLIRPELAVLGGLAWLLIFIATPGWRRRLVIFIAGAALPIGYQIFRMGYYGLLVPSPALAKEASGSKWSQGLTYLANFNNPYLLWIPALLLLGLGLVLLVVRSRSWWVRHDIPAGYSWLTRTLQAPLVVVGVFVAAGLIQALYWVHQGGDFMHGRVLLLPLFTMMAPIAVIPVVVPDGRLVSREAGYLLAGGTTVLWMMLAGWAAWAANSPGMGRDATWVTDTGIVDERRFYSQATGNAHPLTAADYLDYPRMRAVLVAIENTPDGALLLPSGNYDQWDVVPAIPPPADLPPDAPERLNPPHTVFFTNMGMVGMNVGLNVRVIDQIGLINPLAMHTHRVEGGRIGHDKDLFPDWAVAEGPFLAEPPYLPAYLDENWVIEARAALDCPATESRLFGIRAPMTPRLFFSNLTHAASFTKYRIDRVPKYELIRCGLVSPPLKGEQYAGFPATGP